MQNHAGRLDKNVLLALVYDGPGVTTQTPQKRGVCVLRKVIYIHTHPSKHKKYKYTKIQIYKNIDIQIYKNTKYKNTMYG